MSEQTPDVFHECTCSDTKMCGNCKSTPQTPEHMKTTVQQDCYDCKQPINACACQTPEQEAREFAKSLYVRGCLEAHTESADEIMDEVELAYISKTASLRTKLAVFDLVADLQQQVKTLRDALVKWNDEVHNETCGIQCTALCKRLRALRSLEPEGK